MTETEKRRKAFMHDAFSKNASINKNNLANKSVLTATLKAQPGVKYNMILYNIIWYDLRHASKNSNPIGLTILVLE